MRITLKHLETGKARTLKIGWSWTLFFFSSLYGIPLFLRGLKSWGWLMLAVALFTAIRNFSVPDNVGFLDYILIAFFVLSSIFFGLKGNQLTLKECLKKGWVFANEQSRDAEFVKRALDLPTEAEQTIRYYSDRGMDKYESKDFAGAIADYTTALGMSPNNHTLLSLRGVAKFDSQDLSGAIADFSLAIQANPTSAEAHCNRGKAYLHTKQYDKAIEDESKAIGLDSKYDEAYFFRGEAHFGLGNYRDAITDYTKALELSPTSTRVFLQRGMAKLLSGDKENALGDLKKAKESSNRYYSDLASKALETFYK
jgi:tetratricopeptide (TPR) repeat protein